MSYSSNDAVSPSSTFGSRARSIANQMNGLFAACAAGVLILCFVATLGFQIIQAHAVDLDDDAGHEIDGYTTFDLTAQRQTDYGTFGLYEPIHGSAPDIAGQGKADPLGAILSGAMLLRHALGEEDAASQIEHAVAACLAAGVATADIGGDASTQEVTQAVVERIGAP